MIRILYEDESIIVVWKPVGMESQTSRGFAADMVSEIRRHIHNVSTKSGEPYVGVIHRLDKPVSGVMVYAKTKNAAASLSRQVADHKIQKTYLAVLCGKPVDNVDKFVDYLLKDEKENRSRIVDKGITGAKRAELAFRVLETVPAGEAGQVSRPETVPTEGGLPQESCTELTLAEIKLLTGRHHQIRVQMAGHGLPLWGDNRYNPMFGPSCTRRADVALSAWKLGFIHPVTGKPMEFEQLPEGNIFRIFSLFAEKS